MGATLTWTGKKASGNGNTGGSANNLHATFDGGSFGFNYVRPGKDTDFALSVSSVGGKGSSGDHSTVFNGIATSDPGGAGGAAGTATLDFKSGFVKGSIGKGSTPPFLQALSQGGDGANSDHAQVDTQGTAQGGVGGAGGKAAGASVTIGSGRFDGTIAFEESSDTSIVRAAAMARQAARRTSTSTGRPEVATAASVAQRAPRPPPSRAARSI